jgi:tripartite ATP-independent transporter DctM subunit
MTTVLGWLVVWMGIGVPIGVAIGITALGLFYLKGIPLTALPLNMFVGMEQFVFLAMPLFMIAGELMNRAALAQTLIDFAASIVGAIRGGLAMATIGTSMIFAEISVSAVADAAALGSILIPQMKQRGYPAAFATALISASSSIAIIIPPSLAFILYGALANVSVIKLFIAGFVPGVIVGLTLMLFSYGFTVRYGWPTERAFSFINVWVCFKKASWALSMPVVILGGILGGIFTPTEAAAVAVAVAFILGKLVYRTLNWSDLPEILLVSIKRTSLVLLMVGTSAALGWYLSNEGIPQRMAAAMLAYSSNKYVILAIINAVLLLLGVILHSSAMLVLTVPIFVPLVNALGIDLIHFGVVMCITQAIGQQTPPVASVLLTSCAIGKTSVGETMRYNKWFILAMFLVLQLVTYVPSLSLYLPSLLAR